MQLRSFEATTLELALSFSLIFSLLPWRERKENEETQLKELEEHLFQPFHLNFK